MLLSDLRPVKLVVDLDLFVVLRPVEFELRQGSFDFVQQVELVLHIVGRPVLEREPCCNEFLRGHLRVIQNGKVSVESLSHGCVGGLL